MSGHSKWSTIKRAKGAADAKRGNAFTKLALAITIAAKKGNSGDPESNPRLRLTLEQARAMNLPKENIQRAVDRGLGKLGGQTFEEVVYEGFGPGKVAYILEAVTDNKLRTLAEIKNQFDRAGGNLGNAGSVSYMFEKKGEIVASSKGQDKDSELLEIIDTGAQDVEDYEEDGVQKYLISTLVPDLSQVSNKLAQLGYKVESAQISFSPTTTVEITDQEVAQKVLAFTQHLEDNDDIHKVYANFDIPEEILNTQ